MSRTRVAGLTRGSMRVLSSGSLVVGDRHRRAPARRAALRPAPGPGARLRAAPRAARRRLPRLAPREPAPRPLRARAASSPRSLASWRRRVVLRRRGLGRLGPRSAARSIWLVGEVRLHGRVLRLGAPAELLPGRLADGEADGHGARQRRRPQPSSFPPHDPWQSGDRRQLLLLRPLPRRVPRAADRDRPGRRLQPRASRSSSRSSRHARVRSRRDAVRGRATACGDAPRARRSRRARPRRRSRRSLGNIAGGIQLLREPGPDRRLRLVVALPRDRRERRTSSRGSASSSATSTRT